MSEDTFKTIYDLIINPSEGLDEVRRKKSWFLLFAVFAAANLSRVVGGISSLSLGGSFGRPLMVMSLGFGFIGWILAWVVIAGVFHLSAELWKAEGNVKELFMMLGFCLVPVLFIAPLSLIAGGLGRAAIFFFILFTGGIFMWSAVMAIITIRKVYNCSLEVALRIFFTPLFLVFICILILPVVLLLGAAAAL